MIVVARTSASLPTAAQLMRSNGFLTLAANEPISQILMADQGDVLVLDHRQQVIGYLGLQQTTFLRQVLSNKQISSEIIITTVMIAISEYIEASASFATCLEQFQRSNTELLPVMKHDQLVGVITTLELLKSVAERNSYNESLLSQLDMELQHKNEYLGILSHDIRTPLSVIALSCEYMLSENHRNNFPADYRSFLDRIQRNVTSAVAMATNIMHGLRRDNFKKITCQETSIAEFLVHIAANLTVIAAQKNIEVVVECQQSISVPIDTNLIQHVIENLVINAVKFSPECTKVHITAEFQKQLVGGYLVLSVSDEGPGIREEDAARIFAKYEQGSQVQESLQGVGIGLAIVHKFVNLHGGRIELESVFGQGASFKIYLPGARLLTASESALLPRSHVLLMVEDDLDLLEYFAEGLASYGFTVVTATNGEQGYQEFLRLKPDIVLTDIMMPKVDGLELLALIRNYTDSSHTPVVFFTGFYPGLAEDLAGCSFQPDQIANKPATVEELLATLRLCLPQVEQSDFLKNHGI